MILKKFFIRFFLNLTIIISFLINIKFLVFAETNPYGIDFNFNSDAIYFINIDTNTVIYEKNKDLKLPASALVKIMSTIIILESNECKKNPAAFLNKKIKAKRYIFDRLFNKGASTADIRPEEEITIKDALHASMIQSSCEASMMLCDYMVGEKTEDFVDMMNKKAEELGMKNTFFFDPDGLELDGQLTTAYDMYILTNYCLKNKLFKEIALKQTYEIPPTNKHTKPTKLVHTNKLTNKSLGKNYYDKRVKGIRTGDVEDKENLICLAENEEKYKYLLINLGAVKTKKESRLYIESKQLLDWAFNNLKLVIVAVPGEKTIPNNIEINMGKKDDILTLTPTEQLTLLLPKTIDKSNIYWDTSKLPKKLDAPIEKGETIGKVNLFLSDQIIAEVDVCAAKDVEIDILSYASNIINKTIFSWWFISIVILVPAATIIFAKKRNLIKKRNKRKKIKRYKPFK